MEIPDFLGAGNNPTVSMTVDLAVAVPEVISDNKAASANAEAALIFYVSEINPEG